MKNWLCILTSVCLLALIMGSACTQGGDTVPSPGFHIISFHQAQAVDNCSGGRSYYPYKIQFEDLTENNTKLYSPALISLDMKDTIVGGRLRANPDTAIFSLHATVTAYYFNSQENSGYFAYILKSDLNDPLNYYLAEVAEDTIIMGLFASNCFERCCSGGDDSRYWAGIESPAPSAIYARAEIETQYGKLCGETYDWEDSAQTGAWITIKEAPAYQTGSFVQFGYMRFRFGTSTPQEALYVEEWEVGSIDPPEFRPSLHLPPLEGTIPKYEIEIISDTSTYDVFRCILNDVDTIFTVLDATNLWEPTTGQYVMWAGEIRGFETDLPGTPNDKVLFDNCAYQPYGSAVFTADFNSFRDFMILSAPDGEWGLDYDKVNDRSWFTIWDNNTLP